LANYEHAGVISSVAFSPDNVSLAVSDWNSGITIRDVLSGKTTYKLKESDSRVQTIGFLPNNRFFVAGSDDGVIRLWDLDKDNGQLSKVVVAHSKPVTTLAFAPDGFTLASGSEDHCVAIWDILYGEKLSGLIGHTASVWGVDFSQNGRLLASVADDCTIRVWAVK
jgi:WD40 repeat protein